MGRIFCLPSLSVLKVKQERPRLNKMRGYSVSRKGGLTTGTPKVGELWSETSSLICVLRIGRRC